MLVVLVRSLSKVRLDTSCSSGDDATMAARLITLLRDPETARQMGGRGRDVVEEKFSCEAQLARTEELYDRLLKCHK